MRKDANVDYDKIWEVYEIPKISKNKDRAKRKTISSYWDEYLKELGKPENFPWESLTKLEQDKFIYIKIRKLMKDRYVVSDKAWADIENKINRYIHNSPLAVDERIQARNESEINLYRNHQTTTNSKAKKQKAYNALRRDIQANVGVPLPTQKDFEKMLSLNAETGGEGKAKKQPIRAYDFVVGDNLIGVDPMLIMGVYQRIILKVLEEKHGLKVDYDMIDQCLLCSKEFREYCRYKNIDVENYGKLTEEYVESEDGEKSKVVYIKFPTEYDADNMDMTEEEFKELKERYAEYLFYKKKLDELKPLYRYEKD